MVYKINLLKVVLVFRNTFLWVLAFILTMVYTNRNEAVDQSLILFIAIAFVPVILPLVLLFIQYLSHSTCSVKISNNQIFINANEHAFSDIILEKYQSTKKHNDTPAYLPWSAGTFYYYKITTRNENVFYVTCLMDRSRNSFEDKIKEKCIDIQIRNEFYPWIKKG